MSTRLCPFDGCAQAIPSDKFACGAHWNGLPAHLKSEAWSIYQSWYQGRISGAELRRRQRAIVEAAQQAEARAQEGGEG